MYSIKVFCNLAKGNTNKNQITMRTVSQIEESISKLEDHKSRNLIGSYKQYASELNQLEYELHLAKRNS